MASREEELKELAELEELAQLEALAAQETGIMPSSPKEPGLLEKATRGLNLAGGAVRGAIAGAVEPLIGKDIVSAEEVASGTVPGTSELLARAGMGEGYRLSDLLSKAAVVNPLLAPANLMYSTGILEKGGTFDPTARGMAGLAGDIATDPATYLLPYLKGVKAAVPASKAAVRFGEILLNPIGEAVTAGAKGLGTLGEMAATKLSQFTPEEAKQYIRNAPAVKEAVKLLGGKENLDIAQEKAYAALNKMRETLSKAGIQADAEYNELIQGKNVTLNLNTIKELARDLPEKTKNEVLNIAKKVETNLEAYRPFQPEFATTEARQRGVEGLTYAPKQPEIIPSEVAIAAEEQPSLFAMEALPETAPPQFVRTPQPPFMEQVATPKAGPSQMDFLMSQLEATKVPAGTTKAMPGFSEYFPSEATPFSQMLQEPLPIPARSTLPELATVAAPEARRLKQIAQQEAAYGRSVPVTAKGAPRYTEYADIANMINEQLRTIEGTKALDDFMRQGMVLQEAIEKGEMAPLQFLKTQSEDVSATLARAAKRTGDKGVFDLANQLSAARKIIGKGDYDDWVSRAGLRLAGRSSLKAIDKFAQTGKATQQMLNTVMKDPNVPSQVWMQMLRSKPEGEQK